MSKLPKKVKSERAGFREEVLNVKLAELLSRSGILSIPETILYEGKGKRLPDVTMGEYWGVRVVIEGRIGDNLKVRESLDQTCQQRIEEGVCAIAIGVVYPSDLRHANWALLEAKIRASSLSIKVFTEGGSGGWVNSNLEGLSEVLRRAYESLVSENVVNSAVDDLRGAIEEASRDFANSPGTSARLQELLVLPHGEEETIEEDAS